MCRARLVDLRAGAEKAIWSQCTSIVTLFAVILQTTGDSSEQELKNKSYFWINCEVLVLTLKIKEKFCFEESS